MFMFNVYVMICSVMFCYAMLHCVVFRHTILQGFPPPHNLRLACRLPTALPICQAGVLSVAKELRREMMRLPGYLQSERMGP